MPKSPPPLPEYFVQSSYSQGEMEGIWTNHFQGDLVGLFAKRYPLADIQSRFDLQSKRVFKLYHQTNINVVMNNGYIPEGRSIVAGSWVTNGLPYLSITAPSLIDIYKSEQNKNPLGFDERVRHAFVVYVMHEFDHLAFDESISKYTRANPPPLDVLVDRERSIWALTCEYTIRPMVENHHLELTESENLYYDEWLKAGRNADSQSWKDFIYRNYSRLR